MDDHRTAMTVALKSILVPALRLRAFKGSLPHFYRNDSARIEFLTVQFNRSGGSFVVEIAKCGPAGIEHGYGSELPMQKLNTHYFRDRFRLGADKSSGIDDHWFEFGPKMYDPPSPLRQSAFYKAIAAQVVSHFETQAQGWWNAS